MYCIYQITNKINGHRYIGQHKYSDETNPMGKYKGSGLLLHKAYGKYGIENFEIEILYKRVRDKATIDAMEIWAIKKYKPEYNIARGGTGGFTRPTSSNKGYHWYTNGITDIMCKDCPAGFYKGRSTLPPCTEEHKKKTSEILKGKPHSAEHNRKVSESQKGKKIPDERKKRISATLKSKSSEIFTDSYRKQHSEIMKEWWRVRKSAHK